MIAAFTGHRPDKFGDWDPGHPVIPRIRKELRDVLAREWPLYAISGMALGFDTWAAETCIELGIPFIAVIPCDNMDARWSLPAQQRFQMLCSQAREIIVVSPGPYQRWKMQKRNEWMVDHCSKLIAAFDGSPGGTYNCLEYAAQVGRFVQYLEWRD